MYPMKTKSTNADHPEMVALTVLGWILSDDRRAERLLAVTGLTPEILRNEVESRHVLGAALGFLMAHEPDLIACAEALGLQPEALADASRALA